MVEIETIKYVSSKVYGKHFDNLTAGQQQEILERRHSVSALNNLIAEKNFQDLKRNNYISL